MKTAGHIYRKLSRKVLATLRKEKNIVIILLLEKDNFIFIKCIGKNKTNLSILNRKECRKIWPVDVPFYAPALQLEDSFRNANCFDFAVSTTFFRYWSKAIVILIQYWWERIQNSSVILQNRTIMLAWCPTLQLLKNDPFYVGIICQPTAVKMVTKFGKASRWFPSRLSKRFSRAVIGCLAPNRTN